LNIGIIGAGMIGTTTAKLFDRLGHRVTLSNSRGPDSLAEVIEQIGGKVRAGTVSEAASSDVVLVAIPLKSMDTLPAGDLHGKIVIDAMNYYPQRDGEIAELDSEELTSSELVARHLSSSRVVKAFNTMYFQTLASEGNPSAAEDDRLALFLAGNDGEAKEIVAGLIRECGFAAVDTGSLREGGLLQQAGGELYNLALTGGEARETLSRIQAGA
jgi:predicted dinucleotide-binding enzyme